MNSQNAKGGQIFSNKQVCGLPVYYKNQPNKKIGKIKEVMVDKTAGQVLGLVIEQEGILQAAKFLPLQHIHRLNPQRLEVDNSTSLKKIGIKRQRFASEPWLGMPIYSQSLQDQGTMADFIWQYPQGKLMAIAISGGLWQDLNLGWQYLPWQEIKDQDLKNNQLYISPQAKLQESCAPDDFFAHF